MTDDVAVKADKPRLSRNRRQRPDPTVCPDCGGRKKRSSKRCRRCYETSRPPSKKTVAEIVNGVASIVNALAGHVADGDLEDLEQLRRIDYAVSRAYHVAVAGLRRSGYTDGDIGEVLGSISKQAVAQRYPRGGAL